MPNNKKFNGRIEKLKKHHPDRRAERPRERATKAVFEAIFGFVTEIILFGWWAFFFGIVTFVVFA